MQIVGLAIPLTKYPRTHMCIKKKQSSAFFVHKGALLKRMNMVNAGEESILKESSIPLFMEDRFQFILTQ